MVLAHGGFECGDVALTAPAHEMCEEDAKRGETEAALAVSDVCCKPNMHTQCREFFVRYFTKAVGECI